MPDGYLWAELPVLCSHRGAVSALVMVETVSTQLPRHLRVALTVWDRGHRRIVSPRNRAGSTGPIRFGKTPCDVALSGSRTVAHVYRRLTR